MALRDLVMGGAGCSVPGSSTPSSLNPVAGLADSILGRAAKTQERLRELPGGVEFGEASTSGAEGFVHPGLPGSEFERGVLSPVVGNDSDFLQGFSGRDGEFAEAWTDATHLHLPGEELGRLPLLQDTVDSGTSAAFDEFERIYGQGMQTHPDEFVLDDGTEPEKVLSGFLHTFVDSTRSEMPFHAVRLPELGLSEADKRCIRDRSSIMARHFFADKGDEYVTAQVSALLQSLDITTEDESWFREPMGGRFDEFDDYWRESSARNQPSRNFWAEEFGRDQEAHEGSDTWAAQFSQERSVRGAEAWAEEFDEKHDWRQESGVIADRMVGSEDANLAAMRQTRSLVETLSQNPDPKFKNSRFLQFVSKMSRGELILDENGVKPGVQSQANAWTAEFQEAQAPKSWADEFSNSSRQQDQWAEEFAMGRQTGGGWAEEFAAQSSESDWEQEFGEQVARGAFSGTDAEWLDSYNRFVEEQVKGEVGRSSSSRWIYQFADQNPYVGHPNPLREGQELFRKGLLSEAILALEAEVLKNPGSVDGWRLLGIAHAENDDDRQAIASMSRAREADPANLEVLLSLGVSHTNELEAAEALQYLKGWLQNHPKYGHLIPQDAESSMTHAEVTRLYNEAAAMAPEDADIYTVLGVLYNLSKEYDKAIRSFEMALKLKPQDYSLWNKLGATQANSSQSLDAVRAYQQALNLKPNYVRAWSNMGIGYANQGLYEESIRYYVRALSMNPKADNAWNYLRIAASFIDRPDLIESVDNQDLDTLMKEFPL